MTPPSTATNTTIIPPAGTLTMSSAVDTVDEALVGNFVPLIRKLRNRSPLTVQEYAYIAEHFQSLHEDSLDTEDLAQQMAHQVNELRAWGVVGNWKEAWGVVAEHTKPKRGIDTVEKAWQRWGKKTTIIPGSEN
jgi:hypothetical protein